ncbi:MAG: hypothetical protein JWR72_3078 [Flavisolibacter sp.]|jgi:hypothetical protein|nr:hypothetical protein [Flavisolibacter sp.]
MGLALNIASYFNSSAIFNYNNFGTYQTRVERVITGFNNTYTMSWLTMSN